MIRDRSTERCQRLSRAPSATAKRRNAPSQRHRTISEEKGARGDVVHPGALQASFTTASGCFGSLPMPVRPVKVNGNKGVFQNHAPDRPHTRQCVARLMENHSARTARMKAGRNPVR